MRRLAICIVVLFFQWSLASAQTNAVIKIDTDRKIGEISPLLYGNFSEHLGAGIYGGIMIRHRRLQTRMGLETT